MTVTEYEVNLQGGSFVTILTSKSHEELRDLIENAEVIQVGEDVTFYTDKVERIYKIDDEPGFEFGEKIKVVR